jgi:hypothetical protein
MFQGCTSTDGGATTTRGRTTAGGSGGSTSTGGAGGGGATGGNGVGGTGNVGIDPTFDASRYDVATCVTSCFQSIPGTDGGVPTGQYCGRIGDACGKFLDCNAPCPNGFTCGGSGVKSLCGADRDAGQCQPTQCNQPTGQYCGTVGDQCGGSIDCGNNCKQPGWTCEGAGVKNVCGASPDGGACTVYTCNPPNGQYCDDISNGCGATLHCGTCPTGQVCGARAPNVCGTDCPLCKQIVQCEGGSTTVSGTVVTGAATGPDPVYNAQIFIPNGAPPTFKDGPNCDRCMVLTSDNSVSAAITGPDGTFVLKDVPAGNNIPLVVQLGHWRYQTTITVNPCVDNPLPVGTARLPRTQSEGNIPLTAISSGNVDSLECIFRKIGIADSEFSDPTGNGRLQFYKANGAVYSGGTPAEASMNWMKYDQIIFPCQGMPVMETANLTNFLNYVNAGGRAFATHYSYTWLNTNGPFMSVAQWAPNQMPFPTDPLTGNIDTSTPKGKDFATWLGLVGALSTPTPPQIAINFPRHDLNSIPTGQGAQQWITSTNPQTVQHFTVDTPVMATPDKVCGRVVYSDFHVANSNNTGLTFPAECQTTPLTAQEKVLEFMIFDLASCIGPTTSPPPPPPT